MKEHTIRNDVIRRLAGIPEKPVNEFIDDEVDFLKTWINEKYSSCPILDLEQRNAAVLEYFQILFNDVRHELCFLFQQRKDALSSIISALERWLQLLLARPKKGDYINLGVYSYFIKFHISTLVLRYFIYRDIEKLPIFEKCA